MKIYLTINLINGKIYIGQLTRIGLHGYLGSGARFKKALKKYGKQNFTRVTLCYCDNQEDLNKMEIYWIAYFNSTDAKIGYNVTTGGFGVSGFSARKGQKLSEQHKAKISQSHIGLKATPEQREKQSKAKQKPIIEYDLQMNIIKEWPSALIASKELEIPRTNIGRVLRLQQKSVQNKIFRYKEHIM